MRQHYGILNSNLLKSLHNKIGPFGVGDKKSFATDQLRYYFDSFLLIYFPSTMCWE